MTLVERTIGWDGPVRAGVRIDLIKFKIAMQSAVPVGDGSPAEYNTKTGELLREARPGGQLKKDFGFENRGGRTKYSLTYRGKDVVGIEMVVHNSYANVQDVGWPGGETITPRGYYGVEDSADGPDAASLKRAGHALRFRGEGGKIVFRNKIVRGRIQPKHYIDVGLDRALRDETAVGYAWVPKGQRGSRNGN